MTSILKRLLRRVWRLAQPVRHELVTRFDQHLDRHLEDWFNRTAHFTQQFHAEQQRAGGEMQLVADAMVRELVRLQVQINNLEEAISQQTASVRSLPAAQQRDAA